MQAPQQQQQQQQQPDPGPPQLRMVAAAGMGAGGLSLGSPVGRTISQGSDLFGQSLERLLQGRDGGSGTFSNLMEGLDDMRRDSIGFSVGAIGPSMTE